MWGGGGISSGGSRGDGSIFRDTDRRGEDRDELRIEQRIQKTEDITRLIRDTIEPDIWQANGGQYCSVRHFEGRLIVNAPMCVHHQIGIPLASLSPRRTGTF